MAWRRLREAKGRRATVIDLYELVARARGLAAHQLPLAARVSLAHVVMANVWPGWTVTQGSERSGDLIEAVENDGAWPTRIERWRQLLRSALGDLAVHIEHALPLLARRRCGDQQEQRGHAT
ncbi:MAG: hypothetical protein ABJA34_07515 [Pseudonocardiales bacterium]